MIVIYALLPLLKRLMDSAHLPHALVGLGCVCCAVFAANVCWDFEQHVTQTFRLWNWLFYFLLGAYVREHGERLRWVRWWHAALTTILYVGFFLLVGLSSNAFYFCSPLCMVHTLVVFVVILRLKVEGSVWVARLSGTFLPVYTLHGFIEVAWCKTGAFRLLERTATLPLAYCVELAVVLLTCFAVALLLMRIPLMRKVFRI